MAAEGQQPRLSVIVVTRPEAGEPQVCRSLLEWPGGPLEILICRGTFVSRQRNLAASQARAPILAFLDDDAQISPEVLALGLELVEGGEAEVLGGPALTRPDAGLFETAAGLASASRFGMFRASARARVVGPARPTDGEEFSLCNILIRRDTFFEVGGLDEALYPGEDPDLWRRLGRSEARMVYHPGFVVFRGRRRTLAEFSSQHFRYGRGRGIRLTRWRSQELVYLLPTLFTLYLIGLLFLPLPELGFWFYLVLSLVAGVRAGWRSKRPASGLLCAALFGVMHVSYGVGMAVGLVGFGPPRGRGEPTLEKRMVHANHVAPA